MKDLGKFLSYLASLIFLLFISTLTTYAQNALPASPKYMKFTTLEETLAKASFLENSIHDLSGELAAFNMYKKIITEIDVIRMEPWETKEEYLLRKDYEREKAKKSYQDALASSEKLKKTEPILKNMLSELTNEISEIEKTIFVVDSNFLAIGDFDRSSKSWPIIVGINICSVQHQSSIAYSILTAKDIGGAYNTFTNILKTGRLSAHFYVTLKRTAESWIVATIQEVELKAEGKDYSQTQSLSIIPVHKKLLRIQAINLKRIERWVDKSDAIFRIANGAEPQTLDPSKMESVSEHNIYAALFEGLVSTDPKTSLAIPGIAESWIISEDKKQITYKLRNAVWSDGTKITAQTVVDSWLHTLDPSGKSAYAYLLGMVIKGANEYNYGEADKEAVQIRALDESTFQCDLLGPMPYAVDIMSHFAFAILPMHVITKNGDYWTNKENIETNGPYKLLEWNPGQSLTLVKNELYWDADTVQVKQIVFLPIDDTHASYKMYKAGKVDWAHGIPLDLVDEIKLRSDYHASPQLATYYYVFNMSREPFTDIRVRRALSMSLDMTELVDKITKGGQLPTTSMVPAMPGYSPANGPVFNIEAARNLLSASGFPGGKGFPKIPIIYNTSEGHKKIAEWVQASWKKNLGIDVTLVNQEWKNFLNTRSNTHDFYIARAGWVGDYQDPNTFLDMFIIGSGNNDGLYSNLEYDTLVKKATSMKNGPERMAVLSQAEFLLISKDQAIIPFYHYVEQDMIDTKIWSGWYPSLLGVHNFKYIRALGYFEDSSSEDLTLPLMREAAE